MDNKMECIHAFGADTEKFLQGQFTCDLAALKKNHWGFTGYCRPDGRLIALLWIYACEDGSYYLCLPDNMRDIFLARIQKFILRDQITLQPAPELFFQAFATSLPQNSGDFVTAPFSGIEGIAIYLGKTLLPERLASSTWRYERILAGIGEIYPETSERFLPQMLRLDAMDGLSLEKGCYVGQEGIARSHYKTTIHKCLVFAKTSNLSNEFASCLAPNLSIWHEKNKPAGIVIDYAGHGGLSSTNVVIQAVIDKRFINMPLKIFADGPSFIFQSYI